MSRQPEESFVHLTRNIPVPREQVFRAWLDPAALARFIRPQSNITVPKAEVDAREGGAYLILMKAGDTELPHHGIYTRVEPHSCLAFTWHSPAGPPETLVTLDFEVLGSNETRLTLRHTGFVDETARASHESGWTAILRELGLFFGSNPESDAPAKVRSSLG